MIDDNARDGQSVHFSRSPACAFLSPPHGLLFEDEPPS
jgi:hypothetical protein